MFFFWGWVEELLEALPVVGACLVGQRLPLLGGNALQ